MENNKIKLAKEVMEVFLFLGIPTEKFQEYKNNFGGLEQLHQELENILQDKFYSKFEQK